MNQSLSDVPRLIESVASHQCVSQASVRLFLNAVRSREHLEEAFQAARRAGEVVAAASIILAASMAGFRDLLTLQELAWLLPRLPDSTLIPALAGCCREDCVDLLLEVGDSQGNASGRVAAAAAAALLSGKGAARPGLVSLCRLLSRAPDVTPAQVVTLGAAALHTGDSSLATLLPRQVELARQVGPEAILNVHRSVLAGNFYELLPALPVVSTLAVAGPRAGRNDPCPCGSGKKYKRCCLGKPAAAGSRLEETLSLRDLERLSQTQLARLDPARLQTLPLLALTRELAGLGVWEEAELAMQELARRPDLPEHPDNYRLDLIYEAQSQRRRDVLERQVARVLPDSEVYRELAPQRLLVAPSAPDWETWRQLLSEALVDYDCLLGLAYASLDLFPELGILLARGCLDTGRCFDVETLLEAVEDARDRLNLPPGDPAQEVWDRLTQGHDEDLGPSEETLRLERELTEAGRNMASLRSQLAEREGALRHALERQQVAEPEVRATRAAEPAMKDEEVHRLRRKVQEMKALIRERNQERASLRAQISLSAQPVPEEEAPAPCPEPSLETGEVLPRYRPLLPTFSRAARQDLADLPGAPARLALRRSGELGAGDVHAWHGVKRLHRVEGLFSSRVGLSYRMLFRVDDRAGVLEVERVIAREDQDRILRTLAGG